MCAYCGATDTQLTRDHVVPRAFWKDAKMPSNPVIVPACKPCQIHWDEETTYFRNALVMQSTPESHPAITRLATGPIKRSVERSRSDFFDLSRNAASAWKRTKSGLYVERSVRIEIDTARFQRTPEKIIRGLFFFRNARPVPAEYEVRVYLGNDFFNDPGFNELLETMHGWKGLGDDVFQLRAVRDVNDPNFTAWLLMFFRSSALLGYTCPCI